MGFKRKRGASNKRKEGMPHGCRGKRKEDCRFSKSEASSRNLSGWRELLCDPPLAHPPFAPPYTHTHTNTPAFLQTLSNALAQVKHNENSHPSPFPPKK